VSGFEPFTEWKEERLWVLRTIEDLKDENRRLSEASAIAREGVEKKLQKDVREAHDKIRTLQSEGIGMTVKNWVLTLIVGAGGAVALELFRWWLGK
jgi:hypothetical protein